MPLDATKAAHLAAQLAVFHKWQWMADEGKAVYIREFAAACASEQQAQALMRELVQFEAFPTIADMRTQARAMFAEEKPTPAKCPHACASGYRLIMRWIDRVGRKYFTRGTTLPPEGLAPNDILDCHSFAEPCPLHGPRAREEGD